MGGPLVRIGIDLVTSERLFEGLDIPSLPFHWRKKRGIMMGEALTKGILALYGLVCEQAAFREFSGNPIHLKTAPWRCFAIGGDDHIAVGPKGYLELITLRHRQSGSILSEGKHGLSKVAVRFCEKLIIVESLRVYKFKYGDWDTTQWSHPFVDSVKIRLLSPLSTTVITRNDHNAAIGKGSALGQILRYLPTYLSEKWKVIVRERFFLRMGAFLPRKGGKSPRLYYQVLLPSSLGGMGLYISKEECFYSMSQAPLIVQKLLHYRCNMEKYFDADYVLNQCFTLLRKWLTLGSFRAYLSDSLEADTLRNLDLELAIKDTLEVASFRTVFGLLSSGEKAEPFINDSIRLRGYAPIRDVVDLLKKGYLFQSILSEKVEQFSFKTTPLDKRFKEIWNMIETVSRPLQLQDLSESFEIDPAKLGSFLANDDQLTLYVQVDQILTIDYYSKSEDRQITIQKSVIDQITSGLPLLKVKLSEVAFYH